MNYGKNVKDAREYRGLSQLELADKLGVSRPTVAKIEIGYIALTVAMAVAIADALEIEPMELINGLSKKVR